MKHSKLFGLIISAIPTFLFSQDVMVLKNSDEIKSKVIELTDLTIKYKKWDNLTGPTYNISKNEVLFIRYQNGTKEVISTISKPTAPEVVTKPYEQENVELYSTAPKVRQKRMVRLSWDIANVEFFDSKFTDNGIGGVGYNSRVDLGIRAYEKDGLEIGLQINPLNIGIHSGASSYELAYALQSELESQTGVYWYVDNYDYGSPFVTSSASFGVYAIKNLDLTAIKFGLNVGRSAYSTQYLEGNIKHSQDNLHFLSTISMDNSTYINPTLSLLLGKSTKKVRWSINFDYKSTWLSTRAGEGWSDGYINGSSFYNSTNNTYFDLRRTGIFNVGLGISGF